MTELERVWQRCEGMIRQFMLDEFMQRYRKMRDAGQPESAVEACHEINLRELERFIASQKPFLYAQIEQHLRGQFSDTRN